MYNTKIIDWHFGYFPITQICCFLIPYNIQISTLLLQIFFTVKFYILGGVDF